MTTLASYYTIVLGLGGVLIIGLMLFIHYLRIGLHSHDSVVIDAKPKTAQE